jgi:hypothetical protein
MPEIFGIEHLLYVLVSITLLIPLARWIIKMAKDETKMTMVIRIIGAVLFVAIIWNRTSIALTKGSFSGFLPGSFCGASSLFLSIAAMTLKKDSPVFHSVAFVGLYGGLTTLIYPDFIGQSNSIFYPMTISGLVHHTVMIFLVLMMFRLGFVKPTLKKWHLFPIGLSFYMVYGLVLISELGYGDAMHINEPILSGTPLNWFVLGWIVLALHAGVLFAYDTLRERRQAKKTVTVEIM